MNPRRYPTVARVLLALLAVLGSAAVTDPARTLAQQTNLRGKAEPVLSKGVKPGQPTEPLKVQLPGPQFIGTEKDIRPAPTLEPYDEDAGRPPFLVPKGCTNLARGKPVTSSDSLPIIGELEYVTDGDKEAGEGSYVELGPGRQWVQIDLNQKSRLYAILVWHYHAEGRVYHDVVVQVADDPDFVEGVQTVFNNDFDNSSGLGLGKDLEFVGDHRGRLIDAGGVRGRYVRLYSAGNTAGDQNHYIEVEVHGVPAE